VCCILVSVSLLLHPSFILIPLPATTTMSSAACMEILAARGCCILRTSSYTSLPFLILTVSVQSILLVVPAYAGFRFTHLIDIADLDTVEPLLVSGLFAAQRILTMLRCRRILAIVVGAAAGALGKGTLRRLVRGEGLGQVAIKFGMAVTQRMAMFYGKIWARKIFTSVKVRCNVHSYLLSAY
jgi:hypothetical protein